jgi:hypothetical protein
VTLILFPFTVHFISIKPVLSDHLSYVIIFHCSLGRSLEGHIRQVWLYTGSTLYQNLNNFHEYLIQHSLKSGGTKNHLRWVNVSGTAPYWKACRHTTKCLQLSKYNNLFKGKRMSKQCVIKVTPRQKTLLYYNFQYSYNRMGPSW